MKLYSLLFLVLLISCTTNTENFTTNSLEENKNINSSSSTIANSSTNSTIEQSSSNSDSVVNQIDSSLFLAKFVQDFTFDKIAQNNVSENRVTQDLNLMQSYNDIRISWFSSDTFYLSNNGHVKRDSVDHTVDLYADFYYGSYTLSKKFKINILKLPPKDNLVSQFLSSLSFDDIKGDNVSKDSITSDLNLISGNDSIFLSWESSNTNVISNDGKVTRQDQDESIILKLFAEDINGYKDSLFFYLVVIKKPAPPKPQLPSQLQLTFTTKTYNGKYSPKHVMAAWIEDLQGNVVKTLGRWAQDFVNKLSWYFLPGVDVDVKTSATMKTHGNVTTPWWDLRDKNGNLIQPGDYKLIIEFNETNIISSHKISTSIITINDSVIFQQKDENSYIYNINFNILK